MAPNVGLEMLAEIIEAVQGNRVELLRGTVAGRELIERIRHDRFYGLHWAAHGTQDGLSASDGELFVDLLADALRDTGVEFVFLNACRSICAAVAVHEAGVAYAIGWRDGIDDQVAQAFAVTFYGAWRLSHDVHGAFATARRFLSRFHADQEPPLLLDGINAQLRSEITYLRDPRYARVPRRMLWALAGLVLANVALAVTLGVDLLTR